jgi:hypothetical protein
MIMREYVFSKPNMSNLKGKLGRSILATIRNTPKPDLSELEKQTRTVENRILAARRK